MPGSSDPEARLPIPSREPHGRVGTESSLSDPRGSPEGSRSSASGRPTPSPSASGRLSPFCEEATTRRFSRTEDNLLYQVRAYIEEDSEGSGSESDASAKSSASTKAKQLPKAAEVPKSSALPKPCVIRPPDTEAPVQRPRARQLTFRTGDPGLCIDVCHIDSEKEKVLEPADADAADGWDKPGPAPRTRSGSAQPDQEEGRQRLWAIEQVAKMTSELHEVYIQAKTAKLMRRKKKFKTAPSSVITPSSNISEPCFPKEEPLKPIVIFDWDDTLFPTWFVTEVIQASMPEGQSKYSKLPEDSPYFESLTAHAQLVSETLSIAASNASVAIVTLAARPWVDNSAEWFLPGLDLPEVLLNLDIPVFYAREHVRKREKVAARVEEGVDLYTIAKRNAMRRCLKSFSPQAMKCGNIICIGDSTTEEQAIKDLLWTDDAGLARCKTVKLLDDPSIEVLGMELQLVSTWFDKMIPFNDDFHICLNDAGSKLVWD